MNRFPRLLHSGNGLLLLLLLAALPAAGQRAVLSGTITDPLGGVVPAVQITVVNLDQGLARETATNERGYFNVALLQPGRYSLTAQKTGFAVASIPELLLHISDVVNVSLMMNVGAPTVRVEVHSREDLVATVSPEVGHLVSGDVVRDAPLNGRDAFDLALLQPGVLPDGAGGGFAVAGNRGDSVAYLLDGGINNDLLDNRAVYNPNPDTVAEFQILTGNFPAEYGRNSGGIVAVATRSGTKELHGTAFEYLRNEALDANSYFHKNDPNGVIPRDVLKQHQFGGVLGGPLLPARKGNERAAFFFVGYQGERENRTLSTIPAQTFTPLELQGDFSHSQQGTPDPNVISFLQAFPYFQADPAKAALGILDPARVDPVAQNYIAAGLIPTSRSGILTSTAPATLRREELTLKLDLVASAKDRFTLTTGGDDAATRTPFDSSNAPGFPSRSVFKDAFTNLTYSHIFRQNLLNEFRFTAQRTQGNSARPATSLPTPQALGIHITPDQATGPSNLIFNFGTLALGTSELGPQLLTDDTFALTDAVNWNVGRHNWKFGGGVSTYHNNTEFDFVVDGEFQFIGAFTGNSFADFLLGLPISFRQSPRAPSNISSQSFNGFVQDEWHLRRDIVLTLGLRYEFNTPKSDSRGRTFSILSGQQSRVFTQAPVGLVFPGDPGAPRGTNFSDERDWGPRAGFAWDVFGTGRTSLRGGAGVLYDILKGEDNLQFNGQPPFFPSAGFFFGPLSGNPTSTPNRFSDPYVAAGVPNPFPSQPPPPNLNFATAGFLPFGSSGSTYTVDPHLRTPYIYQFDLNLQHELMPGLVLELDYSATRSHGLTSLVDANPVVLGSTDRVLNLTPGNQTCTSQTSGSCSFASLPEFRNVTLATYNGLQASLKKTITDGGWAGHSYFTLAYTYSHNIDNAAGFARRNQFVPAYAPEQFRASSDFDIRNRIVLSGAWDLPLERMWRSGPEQLLHGWSLFPIIAWRTGVPIDVFANLPSSVDFTSPGPSGAGDPGIVRANVAGPLRTLDASNFRTFNGASGYFGFDPTALSAAQCGDANHPLPCQPGPTIFPSDAQAVANPAVRTYGSLPRNALRAPGRFNINLAVAKSFQLLSDRSQLEFRADVFNLLNHAEFGAPDTNLNSSTFGQVLSTADPRVIQLAIRLHF